MRDKEVYYKSDVATSRVSSVLPLSPTMKSLLVLFLAVGVSQAAVTCDECRAAAQDFVSHLLSAEGLAEQTEAMKANVCPQVTQNLLQSLAISVCELHGLFCIILYPPSNKHCNDSWV